MNEANSLIKAPKYSILKAEAYEKKTMPSYFEHLLIDYLIIWWQAFGQMGFIAYRRAVFKQDLLMQCQIILYTQ